MKINNKKEIFESIKNMIKFIETSIDIQVDVLKELRLLLKELRRY